MKKVMIIFICMFTAFLLTGCESVKESDEPDFTSESEEERTYNGIVYDKAYYGEWKKKRNYNIHYYFINHYILDEETKTIIQFHGRNNSINDIFDYDTCYVSETTYNELEDGKIEFVIDEQTYVASFPKKGSARKIISLIKECKGETT